jgi:hypothetical protein
MSDRYPRKKMFRKHALSWSGHGVDFSIDFVGALLESWQLAVLACWQCWWPVVLMIMVLQCRQC